MGLYQAACRSKSSVVVKISSLLNLKAELIKAKAICCSVFCGAVWSIVTSALVFESLFLMDV
jgi:hypothetical protein